MGLWWTPHQPEGNPEMDDRQPPKMAHEAPGLVWRERKNGRWVATWQARTDLIEKTPLKSLGSVSHQRHKSRLGRQEDDDGRSF